MFRCFFAIVFSLVQLISCQSKNASQLTDNESAIVRDSVLQMATQIAADVTRDGPIAWLSHFSDTAGFFMASEGALLFPSYDSASIFVRTKLGQFIKKIELTWSDIRIDPLSVNLAILGASYKELITDPTGNIKPESGYFTGLAEKTSNGWKLRDAHWSVLDSKGKL